MRVATTDTSISESEWDLMRVIWTMGACSAADIVYQLQRKKHWQPSTTKTLIHRLVKKGLLSTKPDGRRYIYDAKIDQASALKQADSEFLATVCQKQQGKLLFDMIDKAEISQSDLDQLAQLIAQKKKTAPKEVACNCCFNMDMD